MQATESAKASLFSSQSKKTNLILFGRDETKLGDVSRQCEDEGVKVSTYTFDIADSTKRDQVVNEVLQTHSVDALINCAGIWHKVGDLTTITPEKVQEVISTNLTSHILLTQSLLPSMRERETAIINIISKSGIAAQAGQSVYAASKYGMKGFTDVLREDTKSEPIRIGAVYQSGTSTQMFAKAGDDFPVENFTNPDDLADVVVFMLSRPAKIWLNEVQVVY